MEDDFAPIRRATPIHPEDLELFGAFDFLYPIVVEGMKVLVPEGNSVLRALQYVEIYDRSIRMPWRDYCWNNTQGCCEATVREAKGAPEKVVRACMVAVRPGMEIVHLPKGGRTCSPR